MRVKKPSKQKLMLDGDMKEGVSANAQNVESDVESDSVDDISHQAPLICSRYEEDSETDVAEDFHAEPDTDPKSTSWLDALPTPTRRHLNSCSNPFVNDNLLNQNRASQFSADDEVFRMAPFRPFDFDVLLTPNGNCGYSEQFPDDHAFATAPWALRVVPPESDEDASQVFDKAPLGFLSLIVPLASNF